VEEVEYVRCSECEKVFDSNTDHRHEHYLGIEFYTVEKCRGCRKWVAESEMNWESLCESCYEKSSWGQSEGLPPFIQRATFYGQWNWLTKKGQTTVEIFVSDWLEKFGFEESAPLAMLFHSQLVPKATNLQTPTNVELEKIRKGAFLPASGAELEKIEILRAWFREFQQETVIVQSEGSPELSKVFYKDSELRQEIWQCHYPYSRFESLQVIGYLHDLDPNEILRILLSTREFLVESQNFPSISAINLRRDQLLKNLELF
jgi:hypothetical protein